MRLTDPAPFLEDIEHSIGHKYFRYTEGMELPGINYTEPSVGVRDSQGKAETLRASPGVDLDADVGRPINTINSRIVILGDFVDTDAVCEKNLQNPTAIQD